MRLHNPIFIGVLVLVAAAMSAGLVHGQTPALTTQPETTQPAAQPVAKARNPHWNTTDCLDCHERMIEGKPSPIPLTSVNAICWKCHDGKQAHHEVHPVARKFLSKDTVSPPANELKLVSSREVGHE